MTDEVTESTALITVEQPPPPELPAIKNNAVLVAKKDGTDDLRLDTDKPHFIHFKEGLFLNIKTKLGRFLVKQRTTPSFFKELGANGYFWLDCPEIPKEITAQIVSFFKRVWDEHKTEAGVILLMDKDTNEWSVFVPYQKVSGAGVNYALNPADIPAGKITMGTMHSHCDFSPFHSGTDKHDAEGMNGTHYTIGYLNREKPEIVNMVMYNKQDFQLKKDMFNLEDIDFDHLDAAVAPIEWDEFVYPPGREMSAEVKAIFEEFAPQPKYATVWQSQYAAKPTTPYGSYQPYSYGHYDVEGEWLLADDLPEEWKEMYRNPSPKNWSEQRNKAWYDSQRPKKNVTPKWEDHLSQDVIDAIIDSDLLTDEDLDNAYNNPGNAQEPTFWHAVFLRKLSRTVSMLNTLGYVVDYSVKTKKEVGPPEGVYDVLQDLIKILGQELESMDNAQPEPLLLPETTETNRRYNPKHRHPNRQRGLVS